MLVRDLNIEFKYFFHALFRLVVQARTGLNFFFGLISTTSSVVFITARINSIFVSSTATTCMIFIYSQPLNTCQLPVGLLAQFVERSTGIAEVMISNPVRASIFFSGLISTTRSVVLVHCGFFNRSAHK